MTDAIVAEAVGYTLWDNQRGQYLMQFVIRPGRNPNDKVERKNFTQLDWSEYKPGSVEVKEPSFISAPTWGTDGIVLEWVQGQDDRLDFGKFLRRMKKFYMDAHDDWGYKEGHIMSGWDFGSETTRDKAVNWFVMHLHYYKPGMYAQALLAVRETRGE